MASLTFGLWLAGTALWVVSDGPSTLDMWRHPEPVVISGAALAAGKRPHQILVRLEGVLLDVASERRVRTSYNKRGHSYDVRTVAYEPITRVPVAVVVSKHSLSIGVRDGLVGRWSERNNKLPELDLIIIGRSDGRIGALCQLVLGLICWFPAGVMGVVTRMVVWGGPRNRDR